MRSVMYVDVIPSTLSPWGFLPLLLRLSSSLLLTPRLTDPQTLFHSMQVVCIEERRGWASGMNFSSSENSLLTFHNCFWNLSFNTFYKRPAAPPSQYVFQLIWLVASYLSPRHFSSSAGSRPTPPTTTSHLVVVPVAATGYKNKWRRRRTKEGDSVSSICAWLHLCFCWKVL